MNVGQHFIWGVIFDVLKHSLGLVRSGCLTVEIFQKEAGTFRRNCVKDYERMGIVESYSQCS